MMAKSGGRGEADVARKVWAHVSVYIYPSCRRLLYEATRVWMKVEVIGHAMKLNAYWSRNHVST
jgi:hypothetical protein